MSFFSVPLPGITESFRLHDAMNEDRRRHDMFRINGSHWNDFFDYGDGRRRGHSHDGIEVSCGQPIGQVSQFIGLMRLNQSIVRVNRQFQNAALTFKEALFFAFSDFGAHTHGGVKALQASTSGTHALAQNSLWYEFQCHSFGGKALLKIIGVRSGERSNHMPDLIVLEHQPELAFACSTIVADGGNVFRAFPRQRLNQIIREARAAESSKHNLRAIRNIRHGLIETGIDFPLHRAVIAPALRGSRNRASTPLPRSHRPVSVARKSCWSKARKSASSSTSISSRGLLRKITRAPIRSASPTCFAKLPMPKCDGNNTGGILRIAFVPKPSREGTMTRAGSSHSTASKSSISLACTSGTSRGTRNNAAMPRCAQIFEAASTEWLSEICSSSCRISQPASSARRIAGL